MLRPFPCSYALKRSILAHVNLHILQTQEVRRFTYKIKGDQTQCYYFSQILWNPRSGFNQIALKIVTLTLKRNLHWVSVYLNPHWSQRYRTIPTQSGLFRYTKVFPVKGQQANQQWLGHPDFGWLWPGNKSSHTNPIVTISGERR